MTFADILNRFINEAGCSAKELAEASGLSPAVISRYRNGSRVPAADSDTLMRLSRGIAALSGGRYTPEYVCEQLRGTFVNDEFDFRQLIENFNALIDAAGINVNRLAKALNYDASYISRIRTGQRRPANPGAFIDGVCRYVSTNAAAKRADIAALIGKSATALGDQRTFDAALRTWLCSGKSVHQDSVDRFLNKLDEFDLNEYIRAIRFDELRVPTVPFQFATSKRYYGIGQMPSGELDFFKATVLAHSDEPVFMCSDMDMADMAKDVEFGKKWMFAIAMCLKKGLHLNMIHTIDRPFDELMLGLESWMPIYMTGQVSPYYLKAQKSSIYQHLTYVSGAAALSGEAIVGHHSQGRYYLTKKPEELAYYRKKSEFLLKKALPLMEIFREEQRGQYQSLMETDKSTPGRRHGILCAPPIYTMPEELLADILADAGCSDGERKNILAYAKSAREGMEKILSHSPVLDEMPHLTQAEFDEHPVSLALEGMFPERNIRYTYETYCRHIDATAKYADEHERYTVRFNIERAFRRMQIYIHEGEFAVISKGNAPVVHFVVRQPKLREAIENMVLPVTDAT